MNHKVYIYENPLDVIDDKLFDLHFSEMGAYDKAINRGIYDKCSCIVFAENGIQFAYYVFAIVNHHHYNKLVFQDVSYFVQKEFRLKHARGIFKIANEVAKEFNCDLITIHCKTKSQLNFFKKMNFNLTDHLLVKEI